MDSGREENSWDAKSAGRRVKMMEALAPNMASGPVWKVLYSSWAAARAMGSLRSWL